MRKEWKLWIGPEDAPMVAISEGNWIAWAVVAYLAIGALFAAKLAYIFNTNVRPPAWVRPACLIVWPVLLGALFFESLYRD